jgi:hypothetical protein
MKIEKVALGQTAKENCYFGSYVLGFEFKRTFSATQHEDNELFVVFVVKMSTNHTLRDSNKKVLKLQCGISRREYLAVCKHGTQQSIRTQTKQNKKPPRPDSASELYRPNDRRSSAKLVPTFADRGCHVVRVTDPYGRILDFLDRSRYFSLK